MAIYSLNGNIAVGEKTSRFSESQQAFRSDSGRGTGKTKSDRKVPVRFKTHRFHDRNAC